MQIAEPIAEVRSTHAPHLGSSVWSFDIRSHVPQALWNEAQMDKRCFLLFEFVHAPSFRARGSSALGLGAVGEVNPCARLAPSHAVARFEPHPSRIKLMKAR